MHSGSGRELRGLGAFFVLALAGALLAGCATPIGVNRTSMRAANLSLSESVLTGDELSPVSREYLERLALAELYEKDPPAALERLRSGLGGPDELGRLLALSELWFATAQKSGDHGQFLMSAVYAYAFLFPPDTTHAPTPYDGNVRLALNLYNRGITEGLALPESGDETELDLTPRLIVLPFGHLDLLEPPEEFRWSGYRVVHPISLTDVQIRGLRNRYRRSGIGSAVAVRMEPADGAEAYKWIPPQSKVPLTVFLRFQDLRRSLSSGDVRGEAEIYDADEHPAIKVESRSVPLESEPSAAIAYRLDKAPVWDFEVAGFRRPDFTMPGSEKTKGLFFLTPYRPGRIPVVFVHGTASSPARWAEMANELLGDPRVASRYQLWFFIYNSGNPVLLSAARLRESLQAAVADIDPRGKDPALKQMVVIGHSQGGLLTKLMVVDSGDSFWNIVSGGVPFAKMNLSQDTSTLIKRAAFFDALPFVTRVVFISTPHKGSFLAENWLGMIARRFAAAPAALSKAALEINHLREDAALRGSWRVPTSIDNMDWSNPSLQVLYSRPVAPWVHVHSIIPVEEQPFETADDGVVKYSSAHISPVESELIVYPCSHSTQATPTTIEEVRRILYEHAGIH